MRSLVEFVLEMLGMSDHRVMYIVISVVTVGLISLAIHFLLHHLVFGFLSRTGKSEDQPARLWHRVLIDHKLFSRLAFALQGVILNIQARIWIENNEEFLSISVLVTQLWMLLFFLLSLFSVLSAIEEWGFRSHAGRRFPIRGLTQSVKLVLSVLAVILATSLLIDKSPLIILSGLGAMTAVTMLVFKDPLLGLVAGIQLSANDMLALDDWLEMPQYGADGTVIDISLTTVKVQNWDKTITTIPSYALISDSFKNWRGMLESGGRRISRSINIDTTSVHFLDEEELAHLGKVQLLSDYLKERVKEIEEDNLTNKVNPESPVNGRRLTNLGVFRAYLTQYLARHPRINQRMLRMVRQLAPGINGIPLEVYAFTDSTDWVEYENTQADIFDHLVAVVSEFGLRIHQTPTGHDIQSIGGRET